VTLLLLLVVYGIPTAALCLVLTGIGDAYATRRAWFDTWRTFGFSDDEDTPLQVKGRPVLLRRGWAKVEIGVKLHARPVHGAVAQAHGLSLRHQALWFEGGDRPEPDELLPWLLREAERLDRSGGWTEAARDWGLTLDVTRGLRRMQGHAACGSVSLFQSEGGLVAKLRVSPSLRALPGAGSSGNPVLDLLIDAAGIPDGAEGEVLDLVCGHPGSGIQDGILTLVTSDPPDLALRQLTRLAVLLERSAPSPEVAR
jgi:hypothetical protein